jgi:hypothetical protein
LLGLAIAVAAVALGCGGGSGGSSSSSSAAGSPTIGKAEFIKRASAACREQRADLAERASRYLGGRASKGESPALVYGLVHFVVLPTIETEITKIRRLPQPAGEEPGVEAMLAAEDLATDKVATMRRIPSMAAIYSRFGEAEQQFRAFGLPACANGPHHQRYNSLY